MSSKPHVAIIITNQSSKGRCVTVTLHQLPMYFYFQNVVNKSQMLRKSRSSCNCIRLIMVKPRNWISVRIRKGLSATGYLDVILWIPTFRMSLNSVQFCRQYRRLCRCIQRKMLDGTENLSRPLFALALRTIKFGSPTSLALWCTWS